MERRCLLAVIQSDLPLICALRAHWEDSGQGVLRVARNAQEAILYLRGVGVYGNRDRYPMPALLALLALDCWNPSGSDLDVMSWLRENPGFCNLPVAMLCPERHPASQSICALDPSYYLVDRGRLDELVKIGELLPRLSAGVSFSGGTHFPML